MTSRQLASHMAGLPHYGENKDIGAYDSIALQRHFDDLPEALTVFDESPLLCAPEECFHYSSLGTVLLGAVIGAAAGKPYIDVMREEVFEPLGVSSTVIAPKRPSAVERHATAYFVDGERFREMRAVDLSHRLPGGGLASTSSDLVKAGSAWFDAEYISPETRTAFWTPQRLNNGEVNEQGYAICFRWREWEVEGAGLARNANHGGVSRGGQSWLLIFPDYEMAIAFNINSNTEEFSDFGGVWEDIFREFALASGMPIVQVEEAAALTP